VTGLPFALTSNTVIAICAFEVCSFLIGFCGLSGTAVTKTPDLETF
jgi:hypothetical protein